MCNWYDKLDRESGKSIRCFVSSGNENPLDNGKLVIANIYSRIVHDSGDTTYTEIQSGNHWRHAIPCEDALLTFFDEYLESIGGDIGSATFRGYFDYIHKKPIEGMFYVPDMEEKYNALLAEKKELIEVACMMDGEPSYEEIMRAEYEKDMAIFNNEVLPLLSADQIDELKICMEETANGNYRITDKPCNGSKDEDYELLDVYIDQWQNGGYSGDDYAGTISVALPNGKYFTYAYQC